ncbi:MAG: glycosyltransferase family 2 protein [Bacteroidota bacterium]
MTVSIIIVNFNGLRYTRQCLESFFRYHDVKSTEVIVVDNNSTDGSQQELPQLFPFIHFISLHNNVGFGGANNVGAQRSTGRMLYFVNNDTVFYKESVSELVKTLSSHNKYGIVAPKLLNEDHSFQLSFGQFPTIQNEFETKNIAENYSLQTSLDSSISIPIPKDWVSGAALMIKREVFEEIGGFDERYFMYFEDVDLCRSAAKKGFQIFYVPSNTLIHLGGKSYGARDERITVEYRKSQLLFYDKHNSLLQRLLVRVYILMKFTAGLFRTKSRSAALAVIPLVFRSSNRQ